MLQVKDTYDVFNLPTIADLAMNWVATGLEMKILSCFYFGDLFDKYPHFKESFVPVCSVCLTNHDMRDVLYNKLNYDERVRLTKMSLFKCYWICNNCEEVKDISLVLAPVIHATKLRKRIIPVDVLNMHKLILDYYNFMTVPNCPTWEQQSADIMSLHAIHILNVTDPEPRIPDIEVSFQGFDGKNVTLDVHLDVVSQVIDDSYLLKNNNIDETSLFSVDAQSPSFEGPKGTTFLYSLTPDNLGLTWPHTGFQSVDPDEGEEVNLLYRISGDLLIRAYDVEISSYIHDTILLDASFSDIRGAASKVKRFEIGLKGEDYYSFPVVFQFSPNQLLSGIVDYNIMLRDFKMRNFFVLDFLLDKKYVIDIKFPIQYSFMHVDMSPDLINEEYLYYFTTHEMNIVKPFNTYRRGIRSYFKYIDINTSDSLFDFSTKTMTNLSYIDKYSSSYLLYKRFFLDVQGLDVNESLSRIKDYTLKKKMWRFLCYNCYAKNKKDKRKDFFNCNCASLQSSYGMSILNFIDIHSRIDGLYYSNLFKSVMPFGDSSIVLGSELFDIMHGKCESCGSLDEKLASPIYSDFFYCYSCLHSTLGMTDRMFKVFKRNKKNLSSYLNPGSWECSSCCNSLDSSFQPYPTRCAHSLKCSICIKDSLYCNSCVCSDTNLLPNLLFV